jgi:hypothetical protein
MRLAKFTIALLLTSQLGPILDGDSAFRPAYRFGTPLLFSRPIDSHGQNSYLYYMEQQLKKDLAALFQTAQEIAEEIQASRTADYKQVSQTANKIRKLASRIKLGLTLGHEPVEGKSLPEPASWPPKSEFLQSKVDELSQLVYKIQQNSARRSKHVINAKLQGELYAEVDTVETLALQVKLSADKLTLNK